VTYREVVLRRRELDPWLRRLTLVLAAGLAWLAGCSSLSDQVDLGVDGVSARWVEVVGSGASLDAGIVRRALVASPQDIEPRGQNILGADGDAAGGGGLPLVVVNHGLGSTPEITAALTGWPVVVPTDRILVAYPEGFEASFNAGSCCGEAQAAAVDDVAFLNDVIDAVAGLYPVDRSRVFMTGYSNGGMITYRYICEHADRLAGAASVVGTNVDGCSASDAISFLQITGRDDTVVPPDGGPSSTSGLGPFFSTSASVAAVADASQCTDEATGSIGEVEITRWSSCADGVRVEYDLIPFGHEWPLTDSYDATRRQLVFWGLRPNR
jgi:polyhydroxybutyrate depolymerase